MEHDVSKLEKRIRAHHDKLRNMESLPDQLIGIIHGPGWTSIAEWAFVMLAMDALEQHVESISRIQRQLVEAAQSVAG